MSSSLVILSVLPALLLVVSAATLKEGAETTELAQLVAQQAHGIAELKQKITEQEQEVTRVNSENAKVREAGALEEEPDRSREDLEDALSTTIPDPQKTKEALVASREATLVVEKVVRAANSLEVDVVKPNPIHDDPSTTADDEENAGLQTDWTQCVSEGGKKDCAKCSNSDGTLLCDEVHPKGGKPENRAEACPDDAMGSNGAFFMQWGEKGKEGKVKGFPGECKRSSKGLHAAILTGMVMTTFKFPGAVGELVATKIFVTHPHKAHRSVGLFAFKRLVTHTCTGKRPTFCKKGTKVADVYKEAYCVKCPKARYNTTKCKGKAKCTVFHTHRSTEIEPDERVAFIKQCLPNAFHVNGTIKTQYECTGDNAKYARAVAMSF